MITFQMHNARNFSRKLLGIISLTPVFIHNVSQGFSLEYFYSCVFSVHLKSATAVIVGIYLRAAQRLHHKFFK